MPRKPLSPEAKAKLLAYNREYGREWRKNNPEKRAAQVARSSPKEYARTVSDPERVKKHLQWGREASQRVRLRILTILGGKCVECGHDDPRSLCIDHVRSNGAEERRDLRGRKIYLHILDNIESGDYQLLCSCHNDIKKHTHNEYTGPVTPSRKGRPRNVLTDESPPEKLRARATYLRYKAQVDASPEMQEERRVNARQKYVLLRQRVLAALGGVCTQCGFDDPRALHIDHVHGGGTQHRKSTCTTAIYRHVLAHANTGEYTLLCSNHNQQKKIDNDESALGTKHLDMRKHVHAAEAPTPSPKARKSTWTPERFAQMAAKRAAQAAADAALALVLTAKREAAKNPPTDSSEPT